MTGSSHGQGGLTLPIMLFAKTKEQLTKVFVLWTIWNSQGFPYKGRCVHRYALPTDDNPNGALPSCNGTSDGNYQYPDRPCNAYYKCECGVASAVKCPNNTVFDTVKKTCEIGGTCVT